VPVENIQVVPFHPAAVYSENDDPADFSARSPHPTLHLLRNSDVERAEAGWRGADIKEANAAQLRGIGAGRLARWMSDLQRGLTP
jgi:hypothetical protein